MSIIFPCLKKSVSVVFTTLVSLSVMESQSLESFFPSALENGYIPGAIDSYRSTELYRYIDGGAELYLSYNYLVCLSRTYSHPSEPEIITEIFDMGNSWNAYGVFSNMRESENGEFGQGSQRLLGSVLFWKGRYVVSLMTPKETPVSLSAMNTIASCIDRAISEMGSLPSILSFLPPENLDKSNILYFTHYSWLNAYYYLGSDDILNLGSNTPSVWARYGPPDQRIFVLVIQYPNVTAALDAKSKFFRTYGFQDQDRVNKMEDGTFFSIQVYEKVLCGIFNGKDADTVVRFLNELKKRVLEHSF